MNAVPSATLKNISLDAIGQRPVLTVENLTVSFDGFKAVDHLSL